LTSLTWRDEPIVERVASLRRVFLR